MKLTWLMVMTIGTVASVAGLDASDLPACSLNCFTAAIGETDCGFGDTICQCTTGKHTITSVATPCIVRNCNKSDQTNAASMAARICARALAALSSTTHTAHPTGGNNTASMTSGPTAGAPYATPMGAVALGAVGAVILVL